MDNSKKTNKRKRVSNTDKSIDTKESNKVPRVAKSTNKSTRNTQPKQEVIIEQLDLENGSVLRIYPTVADAAKAMEISDRGIVKCCKGITSDYYGFKWRYYDGPTVDFESIEDTQTPINELITRKNSLNTDVLKACEQDSSSKGVEQLDRRTREVLRIYRSAREAAELLGLEWRNIWRCCTGRSMEYRGCLWRYCDIDNIDFEAIKDSQTPIESLLDKMTSSTIKSKIVEQVDMQTGEVLRYYRSQREAAEAMKIDIRGISKCCVGTRSCYYGFKWRFHDGSGDIDFDDDKQVSNDSLIAHKEAYLEGKHQAKYIEQLDINTNEVLRIYPNKNDASKKMGIAARSIAKCCNGRIPQYCGFKWRYMEGYQTIDFSSIEDSQTPMEELLARKLRNKVIPSDETSNTRYNSRCVEQVDIITNEVLRVYPNQKAAVQTMKLDGSGISKCCNGKISDYYGFKWRFYEGPPIDFDTIEDQQTPIEELMERKMTNKVLIARMKNSKAVEQLDIDTDEVLRIYPSKNDAAEAMKLSPYTLSRCCRSEENEYAGFKWRYYDGPIIDFDTIKDKQTPIGELLLTRGNYKDYNKTPRCNMKAVEQLDKYTGEVLRVYKSQIDAANAMGLHSGGISHCCSGKIADYYGFKWRFYEGPPIDFDAIGETQTSISELLKIKNSRRGNKHFGIKAVEQIDVTTNEVLRVYQSVLSAATSMQITKTGISRCCRGYTTSYSGFKWRFYEGPDIDYSGMEDNQTPIDELLAKAITRKVINSANKNSIEQLDINTEEVVGVFRSAAEAGTALSVRSNAITKCCRGKLSECHGYKWRYCFNDNNKNNKMISRKK